MPWQPRVVAAGQLRVAAALVVALSRLKHGFESRWSHHREIVRVFVS